MKRVLFTVAALSLAGCGLAAVPSYVDSITGVVSSPAVATAHGTIQLEGKRGLVLASNAYQGASAVLTPLINADKLSPATVDRIDTLNKQVRDLLQGVDKGLTLEQRVARIFNITDELSRIGGK